MKDFQFADLFCGAGGTSTGAIEAIELLGYRARLTAINHWAVAIATHEQNHPGARHLCTSIDNIDPRKLYTEGALDLLWASPECTHHSNARGGRPKSDQSRATAFCVTRWAEALRPPVVLVENVPEFAGWGPIDTNGRPIKSRKGEIFRAWCDMLAAIGYRVEAKVFCAADFGDPTTRERIFVQAVRGRRQITWPHPTHSRLGINGYKPWVPASEIIDWSIPGKSIFTRKRALAPNTLKRIREGLERHGGATIVAMEHGGRALGVDQPLPTVTCARGGAFGVAYILPQQSGGKMRPVSEPAPTISTAGALALIVEYYGNGRARPVTDPLPTVTTVDRFALIQAKGGDVLFRMLRWEELAAAQGFGRDYQFAGNQRDITKQIGNAVPRRMARAMVLAALSQQSDIRALLAGPEVAA